MSVPIVNLGEDAHGCTSELASCPAPIRRATTMPSWVTMAPPESPKHVFAATSALSYVHSGG
eukprot:1593646-Rhodomonas_salina.2